jgi:hypothetical protein
VAANLRLDIGVCRSAADHAVGVGLAHRAFRKIAIDLPGHDQLNRCYLDRSQGESIALFW